MGVRNYPGLPQPAREASACGGGTAPSTSPCATRGSTTLNKELWQPPGTPPQLHSLCFIGMDWGLVGFGAACLSPVSLMWEPSLRPSCSKPREEFRESLAKSLWMCPRDEFSLWFINLLLLSGICIVYPVTE